MNHEYIAILGRQPKLGLAELEALYGDGVGVLTENVVKITTEPELARLGGAKKIGRVIGGGGEKDIFDLCKNYITPLRGKITVGFSAFNSHFTPRELQNFGIRLKKAAKLSGQSIRVVPNQTTELSTATSFHNKLGTTPNKIEFLLVETGRKILIAALTQTQNINHYRDRDQKRPYRDAFVGMLPPKLAQIMINLATDGQDPAGKTLLDPFCGTGVILQEALLMGTKAYGTDISEKMVNYSEQNLTWLTKKLKNHFQVAEKICNPLRAVRVTRGGAAPKNVFAPFFSVCLGDATSFQWQQPIDFVTSETYLGQPFSAPPSDQKLRQVATTTQKIFLAFLKNLAPQIKPNTPLCLAIPAWKRQDGTFFHLKILDLLNGLGYNVISFKHVGQKDLLYFRESQVVARELLVLRRK
ncbi:MAG: hypothetical protein LBQ02_03105 [Candidatus Nomurabacteria bacterium]|jgi:tRNA (guanine10-N2)-dimethyltransferase|nr:hypothetical protein [Candidatus Nomurabacteria bacterium]